MGRPCGQINVRIADELTCKPRVSSLEKSDHFYSDEALNVNTRLIGELQVKGPIVFKEYLNKKEQTNECFTQDGWFKTGDTAEFLRDPKVYKIIGRTSVDVIKSGGYKISALDIEKELLSHQDIEDVAVMGLTDPVWGQRVFALIALKPNAAPFEANTFKDWCIQKMPKYSIPTVVKTISKIPRNQMGKVNKKELLKQYESTESQ